MHPVLCFLVLFHVWPYKPNVTLQLKRSISKSFVQTLCWGCFSPFTSYCVCVCVCQDFLSDRCVMSSCRSQLFDSKIQDSVVPSISGEKQFWSLQIWNVTSISLLFILSLHHLVSSHLIIWMSHYKYKHPSTAVIVICDRNKTCCVILSH